MKYKNDYVQPFLINETSIHGKIVTLNQELNKVLSQHNYPDQISKILGELLLIVCLLGSNLKFRGILTIQITSEGPIKLMVVDYMGDGKIRGYANFEEKENFADAADIDLSELFYKGKVIITIDQGQNSDIYQGIVEINGDSIGQLIENYFLNSEQLKVSIKCYIGKYLNKNGSSWSGGAVMIKKLPDLLNNSLIDLENLWQEAKILISTIKFDELVDPTVIPEKLLYKLFHEQGIWLYDPIPIIHGCRCSKEKMVNLINNFSEEELNYYAKEGIIDIECKFCGKKEFFDIKNFI